MRYGCKVSFPDDSVVTFLRSKGAMLQVDLGIWLIFRALLCAKVWREICHCEFQVVSSDGGTQPCEKEALVNSF